MAFLEWLIHETSIHALLNTGSRDIYIVLLLRFLRMYAYGGAVLVLGIFLYTNGNSGTKLGTFLTLTLLGDAGISYLLTVKADKIGRRRVLIIGSLLMTVAGIVFTLTTNYYVLLIAAILGVISPGAHEVGPFRAVQESIVAQLTPIDARAGVYGWFAVMSTLGMATGLAVTGWITQLLREYYDWDWKEPKPYVFAFAIYATVGLIKACIALLLSEKCEPDQMARREADLADRETSTPLLNDGYRRTRRHGAAGKATGAVQAVWGTLTVTLSPESRHILIRLCLLFALNSFASGMLPVTIMAWYADWRFRRFLLLHIGYAMSAIWVAASIANLFSASITRRIGLVPAMVFTHLPSAIFLAFIPLAQDWKAWFFMLLFSSVLGSMDQVPRAAFVAAAFSSSERTAVYGTINLFRTVASAGGPLVTGYFHDRKMWWATFVTAASVKVLYDILLVLMFLRTKLPEYENGPREVTINDIDVGILLSENFRQPESELVYDPLEVEDMDEDEEGSRRHKDKATYETVQAVA